MSPGKRLVYLTILEDDLNYKLEQKQKKNDKLIVSGSEKGITWLKKKKQKLIQYNINISGWRNPSYDFEKLYSMLEIVHGDAPGKKEKNP